jgi:hypothetical protein
VAIKRLSWGWPARTPAGATEESAANWRQFLPYRGELIGGLIDSIGTGGFDNHLIYFAGLFADKIGP